LRARAGRENRGRERGADETRDGGHVEEGRTKSLRRKMKQRVRR
jgi:hypothetical protein